MFGVVLAVVYVSERADAEGGERDRHAHDPGRPRQQRAGRHHGGAAHRRAAGIELAGVAHAVDSSGLIRRRRNHLLAYSNSSPTAAVRVTASAMVFAAVERT